MRNPEHSPHDDLDSLDIHDLWRVKVDLEDSVEAAKTRLGDLEQPENEAEQKEKAELEARMTELQARLALVTQKIEE